MDHPLDSAYSKLARATEHIKQADIELSAFLGTKPYGISIERVESLGKIEHSIRAVSAGSPPKRLSLTFADALQNLRSSLDHLVYQLAGLDPATPRGRKTQYPIFETVEGFDNMPARFLEGVPATHRTRLRKMQPYNHRFRLLERLQVLNDRDKHRLLEAHVVAPEELWVSIDSPELARSFRAPEGRIYLDDGALLGSFTAQEKLQPELRLRFAVAFGTRDGVDLTIEDGKELLLNVGDILRSFRPAFGSSH